MGSKFVMYSMITIVSVIFFWIGSSLFGGGIFGLWSNVLGFTGCFVGLWIWYKFMKDL
ncbi:MAG: hypothetical protein WCG30_00405 [Candidatus Saccharibacteria bacterium]